MTTLKQTIASAAHAVRIGHRTRSMQKSQLSAHYKETEDIKMKMTYTITMASALLLAAGCAHEERSYSSSETGYSSGRISEYNNSTPSVGGSYSRDGSYSSGGGGAYSHQPTYSGTVGADGTYTPYANSDSSSGTVATGDSGSVVGADSQSDTLIIGQVRESLRQDPEIALIVPDIQISAHNGAIILNGRVQSEEQKRQIVSKVQGITGVVTVNNQLSVMPGTNGQNSNSQDPNGSQLNATGTGSQPIYKDANGQDTSTNNVLNSTPGQLNQQGMQNNTLNPTSRANEQNQIYHDSNQGQDSQPQNSNISTNDLNPTSRSGGQSQMYQDSQQQNNQGQTLQNQNTNTNYLQNQNSLQNQNNVQNPQ